MLFDTLQGQLTRMQMVDTQMKIIVIITLYRTFDR